MFSYDRMCSLTMLVFRASCDALPASGLLVVEGRELFFSGERELYWYFITVGLLFQPP